MALDRLSSMAIREFGEFGGVNSSIECSTTFTGRVSWLLPPTSRLPTDVTSAWRSCLRAVLDPSTLQDIFKGQKGPQQGAVLQGAAGGRFLVAKALVPGTLDLSSMAAGCYLYGRSFNPTVKSLGR